MHNLKTAKGWGATVHRLRNAKRKFETLNFPPLVVEVFSFPVFKDFHRGSVICIFLYIFFSVLVLWF